MAHTNTLCGHNAEAKDLIKFTEHSGQHVRQPWMIKRSSRTAVEIWMRFDSSFPIAFFNFMCKPQYFEYYCLFKILAKIC
jgi:hypothetical protein